MAEIEREKEKPFSSSEKELFMEIIKKYKTIITLKQTNVPSVSKKRQAWKQIAQEFNESGLTTRLATPKQLNKLWYNMRTKERLIKKIYNQQHRDTGPPVAVTDNKSIDVKVEIEENKKNSFDFVDIASDKNGSAVASGGNIDSTWYDDVDDFMSRNDDDGDEEEVITPTEHRDITLNMLSKKIASLKIELLQEELNFKRKMHNEELRFKRLHVEYRRQMFKILLKKKLRELEKI